VDRPCKEDALRLSNDKGTIKREGKKTGGTKRTNTKEKTNKKKVYWGGGKKKKRREKMRKCSEQDKPEHAHHGKPGNAPNSPAGRGQTQEG